MELQEVLRKRRMVRDFDDRPLPPGSADRIVAAALRGPSAGFTQGTELLVLEDQGDRDRFWEVVTDAVHRGSRMPWPGLLRAPLVIVVLAHEAAYRSRYGEADKRKRSGQTELPAPWWVVDAAFSAMLALLAATDERLGALFFAVRHPEDFRAQFGVPDPYEPIGALAVGHPRPHRPSPSLARARRPPAEVVHRGHW